MDLVVNIYVNGLMPLLLGGKYQWFWFCRYSEIPRNQPMKVAEEQAICIFFIPSLYIIQLWHQKNVDQVKRSS